jgi:negative regulator of flagellin synthesis FlgM
MKIGQHPDSTVASATAGATSSQEVAAAAKDRKANAAAAAQAPLDAGSTVALSTTAASLLAAGAPPEFDAAKVAVLSDAIARGTYQVNPEAIADKLIANAQELLAKAKA